MQATGSVFKSTPYANNARTLWNAASHGIVVINPECANEISTCVKKWTTEQADISLGDGDLMAFFAITDNQGGVCHGCSQQFATFISSNAAFCRLALRARSPTAGQ